LSTRSNLVTEGVGGSNETKRMHNDVETLICDATGCRPERSPAGDRGETEWAPVGLFFFL
jgi:hypothetical protein